MAVGVFLVPMTVVTLMALLPFTGKMDKTLVNAIIVATWSVVFFIIFPSFMQNDGIDFWVFTIVNSMALVISAIIICVHLAFGSVEPATWRKIKACTQKAMIVAFFCFFVACHQVMVTGNHPMIRLIVTSSFIIIMGSTMLKN